jgi:SpoVK/Ycf46/Vps4 family AAA+-type ATPase
VSEQTSKDKFLEKFDILATSGVGVVMVHAQEPQRISDALQEWTLKKERPFYTWNCRDGWSRTLSTDEVEEPIETDGLTEVNAALRAINQLDPPEDGGDRLPPWEGVFVMLYPHWWISDKQTGVRSPSVVQCLKSYSADFAEHAKQRLVLLVSPDYQLPKELESDIPIVDMELPHRSELRDIYDRVIAASLKAKKVKVPPFKEPDVELLLSLGAGMTANEFEVALAKAIRANKHTFPKTPLDAFSKVISETKIEVIRRSEVLELVQPVQLSEIGGLDLVKGWLQLLRKVSTQEAYEAGVDKAKGFVAIGPTGTGKSLLAKVTGAVLNLPVIRLDISSVFAGLVGQSEERMRVALRLLKAMAPCVGWVDEIDKAGIDPRQAGGDSGVSKRIMGLLLTFQQENDCGIVWAMTANRASGLPPELLRPGRMDAVFAVMTPNATERLEVLKIHLRKRKVDPLKLCGGLARVVEASEGYVSAEIEGAVKEAKKKSFANRVDLSAEMIIDEFKNMTPFAKAFKDDFDAITQWAERSARPSSTPENRRVRAE